MHLGKKFFAAIFGVIACSKKFCKIYQTQQNAVRRRFLFRRAKSLCSLTDKSLQELDGWTPVKKTLIERFGRNFIIGVVKDRKGKDKRSREKVIRVAAGIPHSMFRN